MNTKRLKLADKHLKVLRVYLLGFGVEGALQQADVFAKAGQVPAFARLRKALGPAERHQDAWRQALEAEVKACAPDAQSRAAAMLNSGDVKIRNHADAITFHLDIALFRDAFPKTKGGLNVALKQLGLKTSTAEKMYRTGRRIRKFLSNYERTNPTDAAIATPADFGGFKKLLEFPSESFWKEICEAPDRHHYFLLCNPTIVKKYGAPKPPAKLSELSTSDIRRLVQHLTRGQESPDSLTCSPKSTAVSLGKASEGNVNGASTNVKDDDARDVKDHSGDAREEGAANDGPTDTNRIERTDPLFDVGALAAFDHKIHVAIYKKRRLLKQQMRTSFADIGADRREWLLQQLQSSLQAIKECHEIISVIRRALEEDLPR